MPRFPLAFVQCPRCTHVWNRSFSYEVIPYRSNPNLMFNKGVIWKGHLASTRDLVLARLPVAPTVLDIGCGEGHFVRGMCESRAGRGRFVGFDPNTSGRSGDGVEFFPRYFEPLSDIASFQPDALVVRHVLEHLTDPAAFIEQMAWGTSTLRKPVWLFTEMPCVDRAIETGRLPDFYYEHPSHFTTRSFRTLMQRGGEVVELGHGYNGEVVYALVRLQVPASHAECSASATIFFQQADQNRATVRQQLDELAASGKRVAVWGGTGKGAAFIHQFGLDAERFPLVVDSDPEKAGTFVPGTGQPIVFRDVLKASPVDVIIVPTQWRAADIANEIARERIGAPQLLIEHNGRLVDYTHGDHPYRFAQRS